MFEGTKRLQTQVSEIGKDTTCIRSLDWDRDRFDIEFGLEKGTTYNSYLIRGGDKVALVDASHEKFRQLYIDTLKVGPPPRGRKREKKGATLWGQPREIYATRIYEYL